MTETLPHGCIPQVYLWNLKLILDSTNMLVSVADSTSLFAEPDFVFRIRKDVCAGCRLRKNWENV